jgi:hypothetical protein
MYGTEFARVSGSYSTAYIGTYELLRQEGNSSVFKLRAYFYYGGGTQVNSSYNGGFYLDGTWVHSGSYSNVTPGYHLWGEKEITVNHNTDGSFPGRYVEISGQSYHIKGSAGGYLSAPKINRQATITKANDFNDEQNPYMEFTNPANFKVNLVLEFAGTSIRRDGITGSGGYTFELTEAERKLLRQKVTSNDNKLTVRYVVATLVDGTNESLWDWTRPDKTMTLINANPEFNNFIFKDINETTVALTGNDQNIIKGASNVEVTIPVANKAIAKKETTMNKYRFTCGDKADDQSYSDTADVNLTINGVPNGTFTVYATDKRDNSTPVTKLANQVVDYSPLTKISIDVYRSGGVSEEVILKLEGTIDEVDFGAKKNSIIYAYYQYSVAGSGEWSDVIEFTPEVNDGKFTYNAVITGDLESKGFNISNSYEIQVMVFDELSAVTFTDTFGSGIPNIAYHKNGIGFMGKYDTKIGGKGQVAGNPLAYYPIGAIYISVSDITPDELFGGVWEQLKGRFLLGASDTYKNGATGGEATHTLTINEMPSHRHQYTAEGHEARIPGWVYNTGSDRFSLSDTGYVIDTPGYAGGDQAHNNMPPYLVVNMWKRIA